jgi:hypothetical protein
LGGHPWFYFVEYEPDIDAALQKLRRREFEAGRYNPAVDFPEFPVTPASPAPGAQHDSIEEAFEDSDADGTRSILDMERVADGPDYNVVAPLARETLLEIFGTDRPTREMVDASGELWEAEAFDERGQGVYVVVYEGERPSEIFFAGYSFD